MRVLGAAVAVLLSATASAFVVPRPTALRVTRQVSYGTLMRGSGAAVQIGAKLGGL